jgi:hypothetical protein
MAGTKQPVAKSGDKMAPQNGGVKMGGSCGKTNADMLKMGRGLAKVAAQKRGG